MTKYTTRVTNDEKGIVAWVDMDGNICISQPHFPTGEAWASEEAALEWANGHAAELENAHLAAIEAATRKKELEDAQLAALKAQVQSANDLAAILAKLANPSA